LSGFVGVWVCVLCKNPEQNRSRSFFYFCDEKKTETSLSVFLSFSLNFQKDAILNPGEERID
jgi:hypothetical protein